MAHDKAYLIGDDYSQIEGMSKEQLSPAICETYISPNITPQAENNYLFLSLGKNNLETIYNNTIMPEKYCMNWDASEAEVYSNGCYRRNKFRVSKMASVSGSASTWIILSPTCADDGITLKFTNGSFDIGGLTRLFLDVVIDGKTWLVTVSGC